MLSKLLYKILPGTAFVRLRNSYRRCLLSINKPIDEAQFRQILAEKLHIKKGSTVMIHSSMDFLNTTFDTLTLLEILLDTVGDEGTLVFPCWHFTYRAEDYLRSGQVFDVRKSPSALGILSEMARRYPGAQRSLHPTNSVVAIGRNARYITEAHHTDIYPSGEFSPFYRIMMLGGIIAGIGVDAHFMSFVHCPEDIMREKFPLKTRLDEIFTAQVINETGEIISVKTLAAHPQIRNNDIRRYAKKHLPKEICECFTVKGNRFFYADAKGIFNNITELAYRNTTIYKP